MTDTSSQPTPHADTGSGPTRTAVVLSWEGSAGHQPRGAEARLAEMVELAKSIGLSVVHTAVVPLRARRPSTLLGGTVARLGAATFLAGKSSNQKNQTVVCSGLFLALALNQIDAKLLVAGI